MPDHLTLKVNGVAVTMQPGAMVAAAVTEAGFVSFRTSVSGEARGALCGMGICFECRVTINGEKHVRSCQVPCEPGMDVRTDEQ